MDSVFGLLAIIILGIAVLATVIYLILKAASYFKRSFGVSLWPGVIALCSSVDIAVFTTAAGQNMGHEFIIVMYIVAGLLLAYTLYRDIRYYKLHSIPAFLLQLLLAVAQIILLIIVIAVKFARSNAAYKTERVRRRAAALGVLLDI